MCFWMEWKSTAPNGDFIFSFHFSILTVLSHKRKSIHVIIGSVCFSLEVNKGCRLMNLRKMLVAFALCFLHFELCSFFMAGAIAAQQEKQETLPNPGIFIVGNGVNPPAEMRLAFEVASIRPFEGPLHSIYEFSSSGSRAFYKAYPITGLILEAYNLKGYELDFAPSQPRPDMTYYDILAKAEGDAPRTRSEFRQMLQTLLAERFGLRIHRETRKMDVYALVAGKNGPNFQASSLDADPMAYHGVNGRNQNIIAAKCTMEVLTNDLRSSFFVDRPIVDGTGLAGTYNIKIEATPEFRLRAGDPEPGDISIFDAVQSQLGLKLEPRKASIEILVVDHVEKKPSEN